MKTGRRYKEEIDDLKESSSETITQAKKQQEARKKAKAYINSQHKTGKVIDIEKIK